MVRITVYILTVLNNIYCNYIMMAVYIDKDQMYFWVIITESHQYILSVFQSLILTQFFVLISRSYP